MKVFITKSAPHGYFALSVEDDCGDILDNGDEVNVNLANFRDWGVTRLIDVTSHQVNHFGSTVSHVVHFTNGGHVAMAWNSEGDLIEMTAEGIEMTLDAKGRVLLGPLPQWIQSSLPKPNPPRMEA